MVTVWCSTLKEADAGRGFRLRLRDVVSDHVVRIHYKIHFLLRSYLHTGSVAIALYSYICAQPFSSPVVAGCSSFALLAFCNAY